MANEANKRDMKLTPKNWQEVADAIRKKWPSVMGDQATDLAVSVLLAQWHLETDEGRAMPNFNLAGIKCTKPGEELHQYFTTKESGDGGITLFEVAGEQDANRFRAWDTLEDGVEGWLTTIKGVYGETLPTLRSGDGGKWAHELSPAVRGKGRSWYTGPEDNATQGGYRQVLRALAPAYRNLLFARGLAVLGPDMLVGNWKVTIGAWKGLFQFGAKQTGFAAVWVDRRNDLRNMKTIHLGQWRTAADAYEWQFNEDPKKFKRTFRVKLGDLKLKTRGSILPTGSGFFDMEKTV